MKLSTKQKILEHIRTHQMATSQDLVKKLGLSRQVITRHLAALVKNKQLFKQGATKSATYHQQIPRTSGRQNLPQTKISLNKKIANLMEDQVFKEIDLRLGLKKRIAANVHSIAYYAFTEMLNNAIDHSKADKAKISFKISKEFLEFEVSDSGIGIFCNVMKTFKLQSEFEGLDHLLKGKQTTYPERHSGQGVFFTSRIADFFQIRSHNILLTIDNIKDDVFAKKDRWVKGTNVLFKIKIKSRKSIKMIFDKYANEVDYEFDRADYRIKLLAERSLLSRSQAKRILSDLESYKKIIFDFSKVKEIGQSFADEIFRVYQNFHPNMEITFINANEIVSGMIIRAIRGGKPH